MLAHYQATPDGPHRGTIALIDADGMDVTEEFAEVVAALVDSVYAADAVIDGILTYQALAGGEGVSVVQSATTSSMGMLLGRPAEVTVERPHEEHDAAADDDDDEVAFVALDLLSVDGQTLFDLPERKRQLDGLLENSGARVSPFARPAWRWFNSWKRRLPRRRAQAAPKPLRATDAAGDGRSSAHLVALKARSRPHPPIVAAARRRPIAMPSYLRHPDVDGWDYIPHAPVWLAADDVLLVATVERRPAAGLPTRRAGPQRRATDRDFAVALSPAEGWVEGIRVPRAWPGRQRTCRWPAALAAHGPRITRYATGARNEGSHRLGARHGFELLARYVSWTWQDPTSPADDERDKTGFDEPTRQDANRRRRDLLSRLEAAGLVLGASEGDLAPLGGRGAVRCGSAVVRAPLVDDAGAEQGIVHGARSRRRGRHQAGRGVGDCHHQPRGRAGRRRRHPSRRSRR